MTLRRRLYLTLEPTEKGGTLERIFEILLIIMIVLNIVAIILDSVPGIRNQYHTLFVYFENFSVAFFTIEYIARLYSIVENPKYKHPFYGRLRYAKTSMAIVDLLAILPFYLTFLPLDLRFLRLIGWLWTVLPLPVSRSGQIIS